LPTHPIDFGHFNVIAAKLIFSLLGYG
jgi:hypothetical protein